LKPGDVTGRADVHLPARRALLLAGLLGACSVLPDRPYQEVHRFALAPERPTTNPPARGTGAPVLLLRVVRAVSGLDQRGLRIVRPGGRVEIAYWDEWTALPAELAESALRRWLEASGLFAAVIPSGSRLDPDMVMEAELLQLEALPAEGIARAALSALVLSDSARDPVGQPRILGQLQASGTAPLPGAAREGAASPDAAQAAAAMQAALGAALTDLERQLRQIVAARRHR